jgi:hypothetical protein
MQARPENLLLPLPASPRLPLPAAVNDNSALVWDKFKDRMPAEGSAIDLMAKARRQGDALKTHHMVANSYSIMLGGEGGGGGSGVGSGGPTAAAAAAAAAPDAAGFRQLPAPAPLPTLPLTPTHPPLQPPQAWTRRPSPSPPCCTSWPPTPRPRPR